MNRKCNTEYYKFFNANPKGLFVGDCRYRAICTGLKQDWKFTILDMLSYLSDFGMVDDSKGIEKYLLWKGFKKQKQPRKADNRKYTGIDFCNFLNAPNNKNEFNGKRIIANIGGHHIVCIMQDPADYKFKVFDTWNSSDYTIGNYWIIGR